MAITLSSSTPTEGSVDFFINKSIELVFNKAIATSSLSNEYFGMVDLDTGTQVPLTVSAGANDATKVLLLPSQVLKENTQYRVLIIGSDYGLGYAVTAQDTEQLTTTIHFEFSTGDSVYQIDTTVEKEAANLTLEGDLFLPTNVKALGLDFTIERVRPKNNTHGVDPTLTGDLTLRFTFNKALYTGAVDYTDWIEVSTFPLLNEATYLANGTTFGTGVIPTYAVSVAGQDLVVTFSSNLPKNLAVQARLYDSIEALDGDNYGGEMLYSINTELYPQIYGVQTVKREVREIATVFNDDYVGALLFKNTIWLWEKVGQAFALSNVPYAAKQYIVYSTILDLMEDQEYNKYVIAGTRRQLGDLGISVDNIIGKTAMKVAKYQKLKDIALESLLKGWQFKVGWSTIGYDSIADTVNRLWYDINSRYTETRYSYYQSDIPASNVMLNRRARSNNPIW